MNKFFLSICLIIQGVVANSQCGLQGDFQLPNYHPAVLIEVGPDNKIYLVQYDLASESNGAILEKRNSAGELLNTFVLDNGIINADIRIADICIDAENDIYICGRWSESINFGGGFSFTGSSGLQGFIAKLDENLVVQWAKVTEGNSLGSGSGNDDYCTSISVDSLGSCYVTGRYEYEFILDGINISISASVQSFLARLNKATGEAIWCVQQNYLYPQEPYLEVDQAGQVYEMRWNYNTNNIDIEKYDSLGNFLWTLNGTGGDNFLGASQIDNQGRLIMMGELDDTLTLGTTTLSNVGYKGIYLAKISKTGLVDSLTRIATTGYFDDLYMKQNCLHFLNQDGYYISGYSNNNINFNGLSSNNGATNEIFFVAKYDILNTPIWVKTFTTSNSYQYPAGVRLVEDCNLFFYGNHADTVTIDTATFIAPDYEIRRLLVELDPSNGQILFANDNSDIISFNENDLLCVVYPNPNNGKFTVQMISGIENAELKIINNLGDVIYQNSIDSSIQSIELNLPAGVYYLQFTTERERENYTIIIQ